MIPNRPKKLRDVVSIVDTRIADINRTYRGGPSLHFYLRVRALRAAHPSVVAFVASNDNLEIVYATLVAWDMNSRAAKMKDFADFCASIRGATAQLDAVERAIPGLAAGNRSPVLTALSDTYDALCLMLSGGKLVSNAKCLHFLLPDACMPMDRSNTLKKMYANTNETKTKFMEMTEFAFDVIEQAKPPAGVIGARWNTCPTKMVDNAIILM